MTIKKISALLILSVLPLGVLTAQEDAKTDYLPKAGDWAVGIDMQPVYSLFGNIANANAANGLGQFGGEDPLLGGISIMGKLMLDKTTAFRVNLGVAKDLDHTYRYQLDDEPIKSQENPFSEAKVQDLNQHNRAVYSLSAGIEFRKGKERIQGYFGGDVVFGMRKDRYQFSYGNAITEVNQTPTRTNYNAVGPGALVVNNVGYWQATYATEKYQNTLIAGIAGKVGVEYFVVPKLSFGGEVSLLISEQFVRGAYTKSEGYNPTTGLVEEHTELVSPASRTFHIGTEDMGGKLFMMFYF
jgi:hypothetical protein